MLNTPDRFLTLFNTPQQAMAPISCGQNEAVSMYTCGPTVYKDAHIGNMRAYITADLVRRAIVLSGGTVRQVVNITDVGHLVSDADTGDDKVAASAREQGMSTWDIARQYEERFWQDADALSIARPEVVARATEHIDEQTVLIKRLERQGFTYKTSDGIYFNSAKFPQYGDFARLDIAGQQSGVRVERGQKQHPHDFALWKFPRQVGLREMEWDSPWGVGFPGWHIECSAMAVKYLGKEFDIHTGGIDHIPIHHTNEIAQAHAAGYPFARHWVHTAFLVNGEGQKMSKSSGVSERLPDVLSAHGIAASALRYMYLANHYRSPMVFDDDRVRQAQATHSRLLDAAVVLEHQAAASDEATREPSAEAEALWTGFQKNVRTDLNTPGALDVVHSVLRAKRVGPGDKHTLLQRMDAVLDLGIQQGGVADNQLTLAQRGLLDKRAAARKDRDFIAADALRAALRAEGLHIIDAPGGQQLTRRVA